MVLKKQCQFCGRFFRPDRRVGNRQKSCFRQNCQKKRKQAAQKRWMANNPDYFKGRYEETKAWRGKKPDYQRLWRAKRREIQDELGPKSPLKSIQLLVPASVFASEIQDEIHLFRQCGCGLWLPGGPRKIQDEMARCGPVVLTPAPS